MKIEENILTTDLGKEVVLPYRILECLFCKDYYVVLLDYTKDETQRNVYAASQEGEILWQIESLSDALEGKNPFGFKSCSYTGINYDEIAHILTAYSGCGFLCTLNISNGEIKETLFTK